MLLLASGCGSSTRTDHVDGDAGAEAAGSGGSPNGASGSPNGTSGNAGAESGGATGVSGSSAGGASGSSGSVGDAGGGMDSAGGAVGNAGSVAEGGSGGALTSCPESYMTKAACIGEFLCQRQTSCSACACCSEAAQCRDGVFSYLGFNDACTQACPSGGSGGGGGQAGPDLSACEVTAPCPAVSETRGEFTILPNEDDVRCVLAALRDRIPGKYMRSRTVISGIGPGTETTTATYLLKEDGTLHVSSTGAYAEAPQVCELKLPEEYDVCMQDDPSDGTLCRDVGWAGACKDGQVSCDGA